MLHGYSRLTADIDLVIDLDEGEAEKVLHTLAELGMRPHAPVAASAFLSAQLREKWRKEKNMIVFSMYRPDDPLMSIDLFIDNPILFSELWARAQDLFLDDVPLKVAAISDLIRLKQIAGRDRDLDDIMYLKEIAQRS